ncbi:hypothetical protein SCHPADRAFT_922156 [Schizopora paradoxa]|uniref:F-box domain-containing protein n=1 Tax=Schizopora paradoxa TaxID=27342 RepID=A0A0H2REZ7_9AGAM|nr:hypothetical protein SCHPADRAFT_922156 [Schizopora paradoxa]
MDSQSDSVIYRYEPSQDDIDRALNAIRESEEAVDSLNSQISRLMVEVRVLEEQKRQLGITISRQRGLLTLARRINGDILARIFTFCVGDGWTRAPVVVSQVCSSWREAAMMPAVWSSIYVDCDKGDPIARCSLWLERSQQSDLDITLRTSDQRDVINAVLNVLLEHSIRWRSLTLDTQFVRDANAILVQCRSAAPRLREISVEVSNDERLPGAVEEEDLWNFRLVDCSTLFGGTTRLSTVSITSDLPSTWRGMANITTLNLQLHLCTLEPLRALFASDIIITLGEAPNLQHLSITVPRRDVRPLRLGTDGLTPSVELLDLKSLSLSVPPVYMMLLQHITAPALESLTLRTPDDFHGFATENVRGAMRSFMASNSSNLRLLELYDIDVAQEDFLAMFSNSPAMEELRLHGSEILDETVEALCASHLPVLCPKLKRLDFRWCGHLSGTALVRLVESRAALPHEDDIASIIELRVINCSFVKEKDVLAIAERCICYLKMRDEDDFCRRRGCCDNIRYRHRFEARHARKLTKLQAMRIKL